MSGVSALALLAPDAHAQQTAVLKKEFRDIEIRPGVFTGSYVFSVAISGTATSPSTPVSITRPNAGRTDLLIFNPTDNVWQFQLTFASQAALTAALPNGTYNLTFGGRTVPVLFEGDLFPGRPTIAYILQGRSRLLSPEMECAFSIELRSPEFDFPSLQIFCPAVRSIQLVSLMWEVEHR